MIVIAKISCYLERGVVTLKLRKEYLNSVTHNTSVLLWIKNWTVWYIERYSMSTHTGVTNCQKTVRFFLAHPVQEWRVKRSWEEGDYIDWVICCPLFTLRYFADDARRSWRIKSYRQKQIAINLLHIRPLKVREQEEEWLSV